MELNGEPKELKTQQEDVRTMNTECARNRGKRKVKVRTRDVG